MAVTVAALHVIGWGTLLLIVAPNHYLVGGSVFGVGLGMTAYTLGMRHALDADHIAAIDNTTRKLVSENGKKIHTVGFWFALGHSSVVFALVAMLAFGVRTLAANLHNGESSLQRWTELWGASVSGTFLILIGLLNLGSLMGIWRVYRRMHHGEFDEQELQRQLDARGLLNRVLRPVIGLVRKPPHMYLVGVMFGLGFDTATEIGLLVVAGGAAATRLPWYATLTLPVLFSAGMALLDSLDGSFMSHAYDWASANPVRKIYYNLVITGLSVAVALLIGGQEIVSIIADKTNFEAGFIGWVGNLDVSDLGYVIVGVFVITWAAAIAWWRLADAEGSGQRNLPQQLGSRGARQCCGSPAVGRPGPPSGTRHVKART